MWALSACVEPNEIRKGTPTRFFYCYFCSLPVASAFAAAVSSAISRSLIDVIGIGQSIGPADTMKSTGLERTVVTASI